MSIRSNGVSQGFLALVLTVSIVVPATFVFADSGFSDLDEAVSHRSAVETLAKEGILTGTECAPGEFCPNDPLERWVMAVWLVRILDRTDSDPSSTRFTDVDHDQWWVPYVERLAVLGITVGCATNPARYCPHDNVTRGQVATFLTRAFELDPSSPFGFTDIEGNTHKTNIDALVAAGITVGCDTNPARYCPDETVTRGQMATFLTRAINTASPSVEGDYRDGPWLDSRDHEVVVRSFRQEFKREEPDPHFTGNANECDAGTTSQDFRDSVVSRVNWYRRIAGLGTVTERAQLSAAAQQAALMMAAHRDLSHRPSRTWTCYTPSGASAAANSNLTIGSFGIEAVNDYMHDAGKNSLEVGNRHWILYPRLLEIGTGDFPSDYPYISGSNVLYVIGETFGASRPDVREPRGFVAWPPPGYVPVDTVWGHWSFHLEGANFDTATVRVEHEQGPVPVKIISRSTRTGAPESALVWAVHGATDSLPLPRTQGSDSCYKITVENVYVSGVAEKPYQYATCLLDISKDTTRPMNPAIESLAWSRDGRTIAYLSDGIWTINIDGANQRLFLLERFSFAWSPDGSTIAYGTDGIWTINTDGTDQRQLTTDGFLPVWSPDSTRIIYRLPGGGLAAIDGDGANQQQLATAGLDQAWSPNAASIAYGLWEEGIWTMNTDGTNQQQLTTDGSNPTWSPTGTQIAYTNNNQIWTMNTDGTNQQQLTTDGSNPTWSPTGTQIAYTNNNQIWTMNTDGTNQQQLTTDGSNPTWSPTGTQIAYTNNNQIWTMNTDGTNQQQLTK